MFGSTPTGIFSTAKLAVVDGITLGEVFRLRAEGGWPVPRGVAIEIALRLLEAVGGIHELVGTDGAPVGCFHGRITPGRVLIGRDGTVRLGGFGLDRRRGGAARPPDEVVDSPWLAPEQMSGGMSGPARTNTRSGACCWRCWRRRAARPRSTTDSRRCRTGTGVARSRLAFGGSTSPILCCRSC